MMYIQIYQIILEGSTRLTKGFTSKLEGSKCSLNGLGSSTRDNRPTTIKLHPLLLHFTSTTVHCYHHCCTLSPPFPQLSTATTTVVHYCCTFLCWCQSLLLLLWLLPSIVATTHTVTTPITVIEVMSWDHTHHCCQSHTILLVMEPFLQQSTTKLISLSVMYI